jgi:hypothetical protein
MLARCTNPRGWDFRDYGARGISVCPAWRDFVCFLADMGPRPPGTSLDRYPDGAGNYEPGNCRWATRREQQANTRANVYVTVFGETLHVAGWARRVGIPEATLRSRLTSGWPPEAAVTLPNAERRAA